jgi:hypothetical protein
MPSNTFKGAALKLATSLTRSHRVATFGNNWSLPHYQSVNSSKWECAPLQNCSFNNHLFVGSWTPIF